MSTKKTEKIHRKDAEDAKKRKGGVSFYHMFYRFRFQFIIIFSKNIFKKERNNN